MKLDNWILKPYLVMSTNLLPLCGIICIISTEKQFLFGVSLLSHEMPLEMARGRPLLTSLARLENEAYKNGERAGEGGRACHLLELIPAEPAYIPKTQVTLKKKKKNLTSQALLNYTTVLWQAGRLGSDVHIT